MDWRQRNPDDWWMDDAGGIWDLQELPPYPSEPAYAEEVMESRDPTLRPPAVVVVSFVVAILTTVGLAWVCRMMLEAI